jgi:hypothetical protein
LARVKAGLLPVDHPLLLLAAEPRRLGFSLRDGVWIRLLDAKVALSARSYQDRGSVVIEVIDEFCPWNAGRWRIGAECVDRTDEAPDLRCDVSALGSVYLGGFTWTQLARALRVEEVVSRAHCPSGRNLPSGNRTVVPRDFLKCPISGFAVIAVKTGDAVLGGAQGPKVRRLTAGRGMDSKCRFPVAKEMNPVQEPEPSRR